jgi:putative ABC transport system ATP-binding protein
VVCQSDEGDADAAGISLDVAPSQSVAIFSRPYSVGTELLDVISGLRRPRAGQVMVDDVAVHRLRGAALDRYRTRRGLLSARFPLLPSLSVTDNVLAAASSGRTDARVRGRAVDLLEVTGTRHLGRTPASLLTPEQQWRVLIARALMRSPRLVLAEDPSPGTEPRETTILLDLLTDAQAMFGFTLLLTVYRLATASRCERLVRIADGMVVEDNVTPGDDPWTRGRIDRIG